MKSDNWLTEKIVKESLNKQDISYIRNLIQEGMSDEEILLNLRNKIFSNSKGMRAYIRQEKIRALTLKLSYRIHWVYILPIIKRWLREKEALVRWKESKHYSKIEEKAKELKRELVDTRYNKVRFDCINTGDIPKDVMKMFERAAGELLLQIEEEEVDGSLNSKESLDFINTQIKTKSRKWGQPLNHERAQQRVAHSNGWKSRHGKSQSHVAWMAGGDGNVAFWSPSTKSS